jgi:WD40 repeat protein
LASCDADGVVKLWDVRNVSEAASASTGSKPANKVAFDPSSKSFAVITNEGMLHFLSSNDASFLRSVPVVGSSLYSIAFDKNGDYLVAGSGGILLYHN